MQLRKLDECAYVQTKSIFCHNRRKIFEKVQVPSGLSFRVRLGPYTTTTTAGLQVWPILQIRPVQLVISGRKLSYNHCQRLRIVKARWSWQRRIRILQNNVSCQNVLSCFVVILKSWQCWFLIHSSEFCRHKQELGYLVEKTSRKQSKVTNSSCWRQKIEISTSNGIFDRKEEWSERQS